MKCSKCGGQTIEMAWVKNMKMSMEFDAVFGIAEKNLDAMLSYARLEFLKQITNDVQSGKNKEETFYCMDCFKELDKCLF